MDLDLLKEVSLIALVAFVGLLMTAPLRASDTSTVFSIKNDENNKVIIEGSSTVRDWSCQTDTIAGRMEFFISRAELLDLVERWQDTPPENGRQSDMKLPTRKPPVVKIKIPIESFDCGRAAMNEDMYQALKSDVQPDISYLFYGVDEFIDSADEKNFRIATEGGLAMAGQAHTVTFPVTLERVGELTFRVRGTIDTTMKQFDVTPPTAFFGLIKAYNDISIQFRLTVSQKQTKDPLSISDELKHQRDQ
jgi:hypothetical protein